jgi:hypothetical protein
MLIMKRMRKSHETNVYSVSKTIKSDEIGPCLAGLQKKLQPPGRNTLEPGAGGAGCRRTEARQSGGVGMEPRTASTREAEPRKRGPIRLRLPFTPLPPVQPGRNTLERPEHTGARRRRGGMPADGGATEWRRGDGAADGFH